MRSNLLKRVVALQSTPKMLQSTLKTFHIHNGCFHVTPPASAVASLSYAEPLPGCTYDAHLTSCKSFPVHLQQHQPAQRAHRSGAVALTIFQACVTERSALPWSNVGRETWKSIHKQCVNASPGRLRHSCGSSSHSPAAAKRGNLLEALEAESNLSNQSHILTVARGGEAWSDPSEDGDAQKLPAGSWKAVTPGAWEEHLLYYRSFYDLFVQHATQASDSLWGSGEGPFSDLKGDLSWLSPDLGPRAQTLRESRGGTELFGFMMGFPDSPDASKAVSDLMLSVFLVDDWIEQQGPDEAEQLAEWWRTIAVQSDAGASFDAERAFEALPLSLLADASMRKAGELCCSALTFFHAHAAQVDPAWFGRFAWASHEYAKAVASEVKAARSFEETGEHPPVAEYFAYRCFSSAFIQLAVLAALQQGLRLSDARFAGARPLLVCASLLACCFNDTFVAAKDAAAGQTNLTKAVGTRRAVDMHNALVDCLCEEAETWLEHASEGDDSQRFVDLLKASTFGCNLWHNICPRYRKYLDITRQPFGVIDGREGLLSAGNGALKQEMRDLVHTLASNKSSAIVFPNACEGYT